MCIRDRFKTICSSIQSKCTTYIHNKNMKNNLDEFRREINSIIEDSFYCYNSYIKNYEYICKYLQKESVNSVIQKDKFKKVNGEIPRTLNFIGIFNEL